jgi:hypothetical protein
MYVGYFEFCIQILQATYSGDRLAQPSDAEKGGALSLLLSVNIYNVCCGIWELK